MSQFGITRYRFGYRVAAMAAAAAAVGAILSLLDRPGFIVTVVLLALFAVARFLIARHGLRAGCVALHRPRLRDGRRCSAPPAQPGPHRLSGIFGIGERIIYLGLIAWFTIIGLTALGVVH